MKSDLFIAPSYTRPTHIFVCRQTWLAQVALKTKINVLHNGWLPAVSISLTSKGQPSKETCLMQLSNGRATVGIKSVGKVFSKKDFIKHVFPHTQKKFSTN